MVCRKWIIWLWLLVLVVEQVLLVLIMLEVVGLVVLEPELLFL